MFSRCIYCDEICPDGSNICDTCAYIETEDEVLFDPGEENEVIENS